MIVNIFLKLLLLVEFLFFTSCYYTHEYKRNKYQIKLGEDRVVIWKTEKENNFLRNIYSLPDRLSNVFKMIKLFYENNNVQLLLELKIFNIKNRK